MSSQAQLTTVKFEVVLSIERACFNILLKLVVTCVMKM